MHVCRGVCGGVYVCVAYTFIIKLKTKISKQTKNKNKKHVKIYKKHTNEKKCNYKVGNA